MSDLDMPETERLELLIEECAEVIQAATKCLRHGYDSTHPDEVTGPDNRHSLMKEIGDLRWVIRLMVDEDDIDIRRVDEYMIKKDDRVWQYLHHNSRG